MNTIRYINISLELLGAIISVVLILSMTLGAKVRSRTDRLFIWILIFNMITLIADAVAWGEKGGTGTLSFVSVRVSNFIVYASGYCLLYAFSCYLDCFLSQRNKLFHSLLKYLKWIVVAALALVCLSQFNHMYYLIDDYNRYQRQQLFWLSQVWGILGILINTFQIIKYRSSLSKRESIALFCYALLPAIAMVVQIWLYGIALLYIATIISILVIYLMIQVEQARVMKAQELELRESEIAIMLSQIQPHFLFNCLTSISRLCDIDTKEAKQAILSFAKYLRGNLNALTQKERISLQEELTHVEIYLSLEKMRYQDFLHTEYDFQVTDVMIPPLTLQPIVENAVRHGLSKKELGGTVRISTFEDAFTYIIQVEDDGIGFDPSLFEHDPKHVGIQNVKQRIMGMCQGTMCIKSIIGVGTKVEIRIPKEAEHR